MSLFDLFAGPVWQRWALTLVHFLWQGSAVVLLAAALLRVMRVRTPNGRYAGYLVAMIVLAACPVVTFFLVEPITPSQPLAASQNQPQISYSNIDSHDSIETSAVSLPAPIHSAPRSLDTFLLAAQPWITSLWLAGVFLLSLRLCIGAVALHRLRRSRVAAPREVMRIVERLAAVLGMHRTPALHGSHRVEEPAATGLFRPIILVPASWLTGMPHEMLEAMIAHELAHIRRLDLWANLFQRIIETVLFFHPATWWLSRRLRAEREVCCDELAVAATREKLVYVSTLEYVARNRLARVRPALALHMGGTHMALLQRVRHVLGLTSPAPSPVLRGWVGGIAALAVPVILAGSSLVLAPAVTNTGVSAAFADDDREEKKEGDEARRQQAERERAREREKAGREGGDRPREGDKPRDGDKPREGADRPRETDRPREGGDRPREGGDRPREGGDRVAPPRDGERRPQPPQGDRPRTDHEELVATIRELRAEVERLRREVAEIREQRGDRPREGDKPREGDRPRDGDRPRVDGDRPGAVPIAHSGTRPLPPRDGERPAPRDGERRVREGEGKPLPPPPPRGEAREAERREGDRPRGDRPPEGDRPRGEREGDRPAPKREKDDDDDD